MGLNLLRHYTVEGADNTAWLRELHAEIERLQRELDVMTAQRDALGHGLAAVLTHRPPPLPKVTPKPPPPRPEPEARPPPAPAPEPEPSDPGPPALIPVTLAASREVGSTGYTPFLVMGVHA